MDLVHLLHYRKNEFGGVFLWTEGCKADENLETLHTDIVQIDLAQKHVWSWFFTFTGQSNIMVFIYFRLFLDIGSFVSENEK
jgi:hypothetical protein